MEGKCEKDERRMGGSNVRRMIKQNMRKKRNSNKWKMLIKGGGYFCINSTRLHHKLVLSHRRDFTLIKMLPVLLFPEMKLWCLVVRHTGGGEYENFLHNNGKI